MTNVKVPVSINGIEFDALISEERAFDASVPEYSVEDGFSVSDAIILGTEKLTMTLFVTNTPVTWYSRHGASQTRVKDICNKLETLFLEATPVTVITNDAVYSSMAIESISFSKTVEMGYAREIPISLKKIRITKTRTTSIPDHYGKSGKTATYTGSSNTKTSSTNNKAVGSGDSKDDGMSKGNKASILYNMVFN